MADKNPTVTVTLTKSLIGRLKSHKACVAGLGLSKIGQSAEVEDTPSVRGMINKVSYMVRVEAPAAVLDKAPVAVLDKAPVAVLDKAPAAVRNKAPAAARNEAPAAVLDKDSNRQTGAQDAVE